MHDLRFALRQLLKSPGFAAVAILSLALGIGANTAIFSLVNEVALKSLPVQKPEELVLFRWLSGSPGMMRSTWGWGGIDEETGLRTSTSFSTLAFERFRDRSQTLAATFAFAPLSNVTVIADGQAETVAQSQVVSGNFFSTLGVTPALGRLLAPEDDRPGADPAAVLSHRYWVRRFDADPGILGRTITVNRVAFTVVGVTSEAFAGTQQVGENPDVSLPLAFIDRLQPDSSVENPWSWWLRIMGRMQPDTTLAQVQAELEPVLQQAAREGFDAYPRERLSANEPPPVAPLLRAVPGGQGLFEQRDRMLPTLRILSGLVVLVLAIACTNVANLLLARGTARQREIAVRLALGASRGRIVRQLLGESLLLSALGGLLGIVFAVWGVDLLLALRPFGINTALEAPLDWRVLGFTAGIAILTGVLFGLAPALRTTRVNVNAGLQGAGKQGGSSGRTILPKVLMVTQVALSLVLLVGAALFLQTLRDLQKLDVGFNRSQLLLFRIDALTGGYDREKFTDLHERIVARLRGLPGVQSATFSHVPVLSGSSNSSSVRVDGRTAPTGPNTSPYFNRVETAFFDTFQIPLLSGRLFTERDDLGAPLVAVINQTMARTYFGEENPIGRTFRTGNPSSEQVIEVVGVTRDARYSDLRSKIPSTVYLPFRQHPIGAANFALRVAGDPSGSIAAARNAVREIDPNLPLINVRTQDEQVNRILAQEALFARLSSFFGVVALILVCIGLYGLMSFTVMRRTTEIGIRMALGALPRRVLAMILREALGLVLLGTLLGVAAAWGAARLVSSQLYGLSPTDPPTYVIVGLLLLAIATVACWLPARRASRVDPMVALRTE